MTDLDEAHLREWTGRSERHHDVLHAAPTARMHHALDRSVGVADGEPLPPLYHWAYFLTSVPHRELGVDGHPQRGGFLPPVTLPRRMRAGGRFRFEGDLPLGAPATRVSTIGDVSVKTGSTGQLCFITVHHETTAGTGTLTEEEDIVYREDPAPDAPPATPRPAPEGAVKSIIFLITTSLGE